MIIWRRLQKYRFQIFLGPAKKNWVFLTLYSTISESLKKILRQKIYQNIFGKIKKIILIFQFVLVFFNFSLCPRFFIPFQNIFLIFEKIILILPEYEDFQNINLKLCKNIFSFVIKVIKTCKDIFENVGKIFQFWQILRAQIYR